METPALTLQPPPLPRATNVRLGYLFPSLLAVTALTDFCLWRDNPQLSVGLLASGIAAIILLNRPKVQWTRRTLCLVGLIVAASVQSAIDLCFSNGLVLLVLTIVLAGETFYESLPLGWSRWSEALWTLAKTPGRWFWLLTETSRRMNDDGPSPWRRCGKVLRAGWIIAPGLAVTLVFAAIFTNGNAMFSNLTSNIATALQNWFLSLDLDFWHCVFWLFVTWIALPLLHPSPAPKGQRFWTMEMPRFRLTLTDRTARLQSCVMLALLNGLFCCVNTIDAIYLWARQTLPANVDFHTFVHQGTDSVITAVIFSALLLTAMFHQSRAVSSWKPLRLLGIVWIAQNFILLAGVFLRVKLYVDAFDLTVTRVNLIFFLTLVTGGFVLLAIRIWWERPLGWLLNANMLATFCLFYTVQFLDTERFVANENVKLWTAAHQQREMDLEYLESLGPPAYDAIEIVAKTGPRPGVGSDAGEYLAQRQTAARNTMSKIPWASWQLRARHYERKLIATNLQQ
jgi:hypothetical protein